MFVTIMLAGPVALIIYLAFEFHRQAEIEYRGTVDSHADVLADAEKGIGVNFGQALLTFGQIRSVIENDAAVCSATAQRLVAVGGLYATIGAANPNGELFCTSSSTGPDLQNVAQRAWFRKALDAPSFGSIEVIFDRVTKVPSLAIGRAVRQAGEIRAVAVATANLLKLSYVIEGEGHDERGIVTYLLDGDGLIYASTESPQSLIGTHIGDLRMIDALGGGASRVVAMNESRVELDFALRSIAAFGNTLFVAVGHPVDGPATAAWREVRGPLLVMAVIALLAYAIAWVYSTLFVVRPVERLTGVAQRFAAGDMQARIGAPYARSEIGVLGYDFDRTAEALVSAMQRLESFLRTSPVAVVCVDPEGRVTYWNSAAERLFGIAASEALAKFHPGIPAHLRERFQADIERMGRGEILVNEPRANTMNGGREVSLEVSASGLFDAAGTFSGAVFFVNDVTERNELQREVLQSQKMEALGSLAGGIAHDFNNMLVPIKALTQLTQMSLPEDSPLQENLAAIAEAATRAADLVKKIMDFSRREEHRIEALDISSCLVDVVILVRTVVPSTISIVDEVMTKVGVVDGDRAQLQSVILNLAANASYAMAGSVGRLTIGLTRLIANAALARRYNDLRMGQALAKITIADTGQGMNETTLRRIFEPFFTTKPPGEGTGLGLAMVHGVITSMGGYIDVASTVGVGTTFEIFLPLADSRQRRETKLHKEEEASWLRS